MRKFSILVFLATLFFVACNKPAPEPSVAAVRLVDGEVSTLVFEGFGDTKQVTLVTTQNWMVVFEDGCDWVVVDPMYGSSGEVSLSVSVGDYDGDATRKGGFEVIAGDDAVAIEVEQHSIYDPNSTNLYIPDKNFEMYLLENFDADDDGRISREEAAVVEEISCADREIASLEGIRNFTALEKLDCSRNVITGELNLSGMAQLREAYVHHNLFSSLNFEGCSNLRIVEANDNVEHTDDYRSIFHTESISVKGCGELLYLEVTDNNIASIDLSDCGKLQVLRATWNNLATIDVTHCPDITHLYVRKNPLVGTLDLSVNTKLVELWCAESGLEAVNLSAEYPALTKIVAYDSNIAALDLRRTPALATLEGHNMKLTSIDLTNCPQLDCVWLKFNEIESLDVTQCGNLRELQVGYNNLKELDLSKCSKLRVLEVVSNGLESINFANCAALETVDVSMNNLTELNVDDCASLFQINASENNLTSFDVSGTSTLAVVNVSQNKMETLDVSDCVQLTLLYADKNLLTNLDLRSNPLLQEVALSDNSLKGLRVEGLQYMYLCEFNNNNLERLNLSGCASVSELYVHNNPLAYLSVHPCEALRQLDMRNTQMKSIDLSNNHAASFLFATENPQLETVFIAVDASYSTLSVDEHVEVYIRDASEYEDVDCENWGDEDIDPWA